MPYSVDDCETQPDAELIERAGDFRIEYFRAVEMDVATIKNYLAQRIPVVVVLAVGTEFGMLDPGDVHQTVEDTDTFHHALLVAGYDDTKNSIMVMNSWGIEWGDQGFGFISYDIWEDIAREAHVVGRNLVTPFKTVDEITTGKLAATEAGLATHESMLNPLLDSDGDGYPDTMEREFGLNQSVPDENPDYEPMADADQDGWPDETETAFGTDPESPDDFPFGWFGQ
jgi:hypothetical protein